MNLKEISTDIEGPQRSTQQGFDPERPEGQYKLNLAETYHNIILQTLLQHAERAVERAGEGKFELKSCFQGVKLNGKSWTPPATKDVNGLFEIQE